MFAGHVFISKLKRRRSSCNEMRGGLVDLVENSRADELRTYAKANLPETSAPEVAKAVDEIQFRSEFKRRVTPQLTAWIERKNR